MKRKLNLWIVALFFFFGTIVYFGVPFLDAIVGLGWLQKILLFLIIVAGFAVAISLTVELVFSLPFKLFLKNLSETWGKNHTLPSPAEVATAELAGVVGTVNYILNESQSYVKNLEAKTGLSDGNSQIITMVSHQMRTPISGLRWLFASMLESRHSSEDTILIKDAIKATDRIADIVEELLLGIGLEQGPAKEHRSSVDMIKVVNAVIAESNLTARSHNISIEFSNDTVVPLVRGIERELRFVVHTLTSNAILYSHSGGVVTLKLSYENQRVRFDVKDNGIGIETHEQAVLFKKFGRSKKAISLYPDGTGLSLYLSKSIIINHDGELSFETDEDKGTTFTIKLPVSGKGELETFIHH